MSRPRLLDLFCGAGGAAMGYHRAGFDVVGIDVRPQSDYPFDFIRDDALKWLNDYPSLYGFDAVHASPPCQAYTHARHMANRGRADHPRLIEPTRLHLQAVGLPYVIENVVGAPLREAVLLCGASFGLTVKRHRLFESNVPIMAPPCACGRHRVKQFASTPRVDGSRPLSAYVNPLASETTHDDFAVALGIDWVSAGGKRPARALHEAIPPAYTEHIGGYLLVEVEARTRAAA
jgi:DNA (cytosine-5)-methyltransferase 1